jgi:nucleotide-binding universal stress UspA family protein
VPAFKNILLPVDFSSNTELGLKKAIDYVDADDGQIHLLHVVAPNKKPVDELYSEYFRLEQLKQIFDHELNHVTIHRNIILGNSIQTGIIKKAEEVHPDLIIIAKNSNRKLLPLKKTIFPGSLAKKSKCAVLTVKPGSLGNKIKSIVIPIRSNMPIRKLELLVPLAWKKNITVYLVSIIDKLKGFDDFDSSLSHTLIETYRSLKGEVNCQIFHEFVQGENVARTVLRFAKSVNADILLTNPDEINISGFARLDVIDMLMRDSKLQVLTVEPENLSSLPKPTL